MLIRTFPSVLWQFLDLRKNFNYKKDIEQFNPVFLGTVAFVVSVLFVAALMVLVNSIA